MPELQQNGVLQRKDPQRLQAGDLVFFRQLPDAVSGRHVISRIIAGRCPPEAGTGHFFKKFAARKSGAAAGSRSPCTAGHTASRKGIAAAPERDKASLENGEQGVEVPAPNAYIKTAPGQFQLPARSLQGNGPIPVRPADLPDFSVLTAVIVPMILTLCLPSGRGDRFILLCLFLCHLCRLCQENALSEGKLVAFFRPGTVLAEAHGDCHGIFDRPSPGCRLCADLPDPFHDRIRQGVLRLREGGHRGLQTSFLCHDPFYVQAHKAGIAVRCGKEIVIHDADPVPGHFKADALVVESDLLHLAGIGTAGSVYDPVSGEVVVGGALAEITAIGLELLPVTVFPADGLIDEIPDKAALIAGLSQAQVGIEVHASAGIAHGMGVFTADKGFVRIFLKKCLYGFRRRVHLGLHITGLRPGAVVEDPFIMHEPVFIEGAEAVRHVADHRAAEGLIAHRPDQDRGVVFVPLPAGIDPVQQQLTPAFIVSRHDTGCRKAQFCRCPASVGLHIVFRDQIQSQFIAETIESGAVGIMAGAHGIDIVLLHQDKVLAGHFRRYDTAAVAGKFMAVDAAENNAPAVEAHQAVFHLKAAEAHPLPDNFQKDLFRLSCLPGASGSFCGSARG